MRHHIYVRRRLAKLRDEHGFTDEQLRAVSGYVSEALHATTLEGYHDVPESRYHTWYRPAEAACTKS